MDIGLPIIQFCRLYPPPAPLSMTVVREAMSVWRWRDRVSTRTGKRVGEGPTFRFLVVVLLSSIRCPRGAVWCVIACLYRNSECVCVWLTLWASKGMKASVILYWPSMGAWQDYDGWTPGMTAYMMSMYLRTPLDFWMKGNPWHLALYSPEYLPPLSPFRGPEWMDMIIGTSQTLSRMRRGK